MTAGRPTPTAEPYRLIRASRHVQDAIVNTESFRNSYDPDDTDLHRAIDHLMQAKQILAARIGQQGPQTGGR